MTISQPTPTNEYRWQERADGSDIEVLLQRWVGGPNGEEWRTAAAQAAQASPRLFGTGLENAEMITKFWHAQIDKAVDRERERCAKIAESWHPMLYAPEMGGTHPRDAAYRDAQSAIAAAIRCPATRR